jgi:hypothetical protein
MGINKYTLKKHIHWIINSVLSDKIRIVVTYSLIQCHIQFLLPSQELALQDTFNGGKNKGVRGKL